MKDSILIVGIVVAVVHSAYCCRCAPPNKNDPNYRPVCASDGMTYPTSCHVGCAPPWPRGTNDKCLTIIYDGECTTTCNCEDICAPLCASNNIETRTFGNQCSLDCAKLKDPTYQTISSGSCPP